MRTQFLRRCGRCQVTIEIPPPSTDRSQPDFYEFGERNFELFCCDLLNREPSIEGAKIYGVNGQAQFGLDILANNKDGSRTGAQCKCYREFKLDALHKAVKEFHEHWDSKWKGRRVSRFIICIACLSEKTEFIDAVLDYEDSFRALGVLFEVWTRRELTDKLSQSRDIIDRYIPSGGWLEVLCGKSNLQEAEVSRLETFCRSTLAYLKNVKSDWNRGARSSVQNWLDAIESSKDLLSNESRHVRAEVLRFKAHLTTQRDLAEARSLAAEAKRLWPTNADQRLEAYLIYLGQGPDEALKYLENPDADALAIKVSILLEQNRPLEALALVPASATDQNLIRLRALAQFFQGAADQALVTIKSALDLDPQNIATRETAGILSFYSAISPLAWPKSPWNLLSPVSSDLVKSDHNSLSLLVTARSHFEYIINSSESADDQHEARKWLVATLLCHPDSGDQGMQTLRAELQRAPSDIVLVSWAIGRVPSSELEESRRQLQENMDSLGDLLAVLQVLLQSREFPTAWELLQRHRDLFATQPPEFWLEWSARVLLASGEQSRLLELLEGNSLSSNLEFLRLQLTHKGFSAALPEALKLYEESQDPHLLLELARAQAERGEWKWLAEHSDVLVEKVQTEEALYFAASALFNAGSVTEALDLIDRHNFKSLRLLEMKVLCTQQLGRIHEALMIAREAEKLYEDSALILLVRCYAGLANVDALVDLAGRMLRMANPLSGQLLWVAQLISLDRPDLARKLWLAAFGHGITNRNLGAAISLAFDIGLDSRQELGQLFLRVQQTDFEESGIKCMTGAEALLEQLRRGQEQFESVMETYAQGMPIHVVADKSGMTLVRLYYANLFDLTAPEDKRNLPPIYVRYAGWPFPQQKQLPTRLFLDVTSLLLAAHFNYLEDLEAQFRPICISGSLASALEAMRHDLRARQPERFASLRRLKARIEDGSIIVATPEGMASLPLVQLGERTETTFLSHKLLQDFLLTAREKVPGQLSITLSAWNALSSEEQEVLLSNSKVFVEESQSSALVEILSIDERRSERQNWVEDLGKRLKDTDLYENQAFPKASEFATKTLSCLSDLLSWPGGSSDLACVDDRFLTHYPKTSQDVPVGSSLEVLSRLRNCGKMTDRRFFELLLQMRNSNLLYLPASAEELVYHLNRAVRTDKFEETSQLVALQRSLSRMLLQASNLRPPFENQKGEWELLVSFHRECIRAWRLIFETDLSEEIQFQQADWLFHSVFLTLDALRNSTGAELQPDYTERAGVELLSVCWNDASVCNNLSAVGQRNLHRWLEHRWLTVQPLGSPVLIATAQAFLTIIQTTVKNKKLFPDALAAFTKQLPKTLLETVMDHPEIKVHLAPKIVKVMHYLGADFESDKFYRALVELATTDEVKLKTQDGKDVSLKCVDGKLTLLDAERCCKGPSSPQDLASPNSECRKMFLERHLYWQDHPGSEQDFLSIADLPDPFERVRAAFRNLEESPEGRYQSIGMGLLEGEVLEVLLDPPPVQRLLHRYGLGEIDENLEFSNRIQRSRQRLVSLSPLEQFLRFSCFPLPHPNLDGEIPEGLLNISRQPMTPLLRVHTAAVLLRNRDSKVQDLAWSHLDHLFSKTGQSEFQAFHIILLWTFERLSKIQTLREMPDLHLALTWSHAEELTRQIFESAPRTVIEYFSERLDPTFYLFSNFLLQEPVLRDVCSPGFLNWTKFSTFGLAYCIPDGTILPENLIERFAKKDGQEVLQGVVGMFAGNILGAWLDRDDDSSLARLPSSLGLAGTGRSELLREIGKSELETEERLFRLAHCSRGSLFNAHLAEAIRPQIHSFDCSNIHDQIRMANILNMLTECCYQVEHEHRILMLRNIVEVVRNSALRQVPEVQDAIVLMAFLFAPAEGAPVESCRALAEYIEAVNRAIPELSEHWLPALTSLAVQVSPRASAILWHVILKVRAT
jgi:tetratricopeptide (TPR) repeat protein